MHEVRDHWRGQLIELACDEHCSYSEKLEVQDGDTLVREVTVYQIDSQLDGLRKETELYLDYQEPID